MDRRTSLGMLFGVSSPKKTQSAITNNQAVEEGMANTIERLFGPTPTLTPPIYYDFALDPAVPLGQSWINDLPAAVTGISGARKRSYLSWQYQAMRDTRMHIIEKLSLFWHNHFVVSGTSRGRQLYTYQQILRRNAFGNFKTFVEEITVNSSMLQYLNGTQNQKNGPNENYARELLELFTLGKGPTVGPGDYTHYTEEDIIQIAKALTGWRHATQVGLVFDPNLPQLNYIAGLFILLFHRRQKNW